MKLHEWITSASKQLSDIGIPSARLDAELILSHTLRKNRTWIHAYRDEELDSRTHEIADARLALRRDRVPLAYITGHREFYGRRFDVSPSVLIPRPESETIIELVKRFSTPSHKQLVDIGTGSGCLGITLKLELPQLDVTLTDISRHALTVAERNARKLQADVRVIRSDLLLGYEFTPDVIVANLPYVDASWERSPETNHEPALALFADDEGVKLIYELLEQASVRTAPGALLFLEADPVQHETIVTRAQTHRFSKKYIEDYCIVLSKD